MEEYGVNEHARVYKATPDEYAWRTRNFEISVSRSYTDPRLTEWQNVNLTIDRPFMFFIRDNPTGIVLYSGIVKNPIPRMI